MPDPTRLHDHPDTQDPPPNSAAGQGTAEQTNRRTDSPSDGRFEVWLQSTPQPAAARFVLGGVIARGGMGEVYAARDAHLGRDVAVKVLQARLAGTSAERRFREEARITGQLQHPGIPPVYDLGQLPDGRPYLAMKLIKGETLDALLKRDGPGGHWLAAFEKVCEAVGYAHAHGVIHRDLKPLNVMVGGHGEVQVMDWGLAKLLGERRGSTPPADDPGAPTTPGTVVESERADSDHTRAGSVLGTPAYMAPEQAVGAVDKQDARTDVFGLGAVLCALLTGHPPYRGGDAESTRRLAARGKLDDAFARLEAAAADPAVVALCKRCLATEPADRPADAGVVAGEVKALRAAAEERARQAELDRVRAEGDRAAAEVRVAAERKRRRLLAAAAGLVLAVTAAGGTAAGVLWRRAVAQEGKTAQALRDKTAEEQAKAAALGLAEQRLGERDAARGKTLVALRALTDRMVANKLGRQAEVTEAERAFLRQVLGLWVSVADARGDEADARALRAEGNARVGLVQSYLGQSKEAEAAYRAAVRGYEGLAAESPARPDYKQELARTYNNLGFLLGAAGRAAEAEAAYRAALRVQEGLAAEFPAHPDYREAVAKTQTNLGILLAAGRAAEAEAAHRAALGVWEGLAADFPARPDYKQGLAHTHDNLGLLLIAAGRAAEAEAAHRAALGVWEKLTVDFPARPDYRVDLGAACCNFGHLLRRTGRVADSLPWYDRAVAALVPAHAADPVRVRPRRSLRNSHLGRARALDQLDRRANAIADWDRAVALSSMDERPVIRVERANSLAQAGEVERAVTEAAELAVLPRNWTAGDWYDLACVYAVAGGKFSNRREEYAAQAVELLRKAVAAGYRNRAHIGKDPDLAPLRGRADFQKLLASLPELAPKPRPVK